MFWGASTGPTVPTHLLFHLIVLLETLDPLASAGHIFMYHCGVSPQHWCSWFSKLDRTHQWDVRKVRCLLGGLFVLQLEAGFVLSLPGGVHLIPCLCPFVFPACPLGGQAVTRGLVLSVQDSCLLSFSMRGYFRG